MPQFTVHRNRNAATKARYPLLLNVQADLLGELGTRVVVPMTPATPVARRAAMRTLTPVLEVDGKEYVLMIPQLAGIAARELGPPVADLSSQRPAVLAALDLLFTGI